jgi:hypothetical protein
MDGRVRRSLEHSYVWTAGLLIVHQIDSAYWQEWKLFGVGGEIQGFVLGNVLLILPFLYGLVHVRSAPRAGARFGLVLSGIGLAAFVIHGWFLMQGHREFRVPVSMGILVAALFTSALLGWASVSTLRQTTATGPERPNEHVRINTPARSPE